MSSRYEEALAYLYGFVNFEHSRMDQYTADKITLDRPAHLLSLLGNPHSAFPSIHIAGTKGKGSVAAMCAACLRGAGLKVGLYTSPHLQDFRDRIRIQTPDSWNGRISQKKVVELVEELKSVVPQVPGLTWYELITAIGFMHFAEEAVDVAVVEVGLGGRLDATNVLTPLVAAITSLSLDHTYLLGDTLVEIAAEKGGIIKPGVPVVTAPQVQEALDCLAGIAQERGARLTVIGRDWDCVPLDGVDDGIRRPAHRNQFLEITTAPPSTFIPQGSRIELALAGAHQRENALVALAVLDLIQPHFPDVTLDVVQKGLAEVKWPGRLQVLSEGGDGPDDLEPTVLVDCAHNVDSAGKLAYALRHDYDYDKLWLVLGATTDKDVPGIMQVLLPLADQIILTASTHPRAVSPLELGGIATEMGYEVQTLAGVTEALLRAWNASAPGDLICVTGSIFVVGDLLNQWEGLQSELLAKQSQLSAVAES